MTDTQTAQVPAVAEPMFHARTPVALPRPQAPAVVPQGDHMSSMMHMATQIAAAGDAIPACYRGKPGAVVLAIGFAEARQLDILTVLANVTPINGKPTIDATLQRSLAERAGYDVRVTRVDADAATVEIHRGGQILGSATYTMENARTAGLASKDNWRKNPEAMLVARATTRAMRWFAPSVMTGVVAQDEAEDQDPTTVAAQPSPVAAIDPAPVQAAQETVQEPTVATQAAPDVVDAEVVDQPTLDGTTGPWTDSDQLKAALRAAGITQTQAIQHAQTIDPAIGSLAMIVATPAAASAVADLIAGGV